MTSMERMSVTTRKSRVATSLPASTAASACAAVSTTTTSPFDLTDAVAADGTLDVDVRGGDDPHALHDDRGGHHVGAHLSRSDETDADGPALGLALCQLIVQADHRPSPAAWSMATMTLSASPAATVRKASSISSNGKVWVMTWSPSTWPRSRSRSARAWSSGR